MSPSPVLVHRTEGLVDSFSQGLEGLCTVSSSVLHGIEPRLKDFHQLLLCPPKVGDPEWVEAAALRLPTGGHRTPAGEPARSASPPSQLPSVQLCSGARPGG